jgi:5'(3')-deoxyribonucleotidase
MKTLLFDMDGVVADFMTEWLDQYNHYTGEGIKLSDIKTYDTSKYVKNKGLLFNIKDSPGFIRGLKPISGAVEAIKTLHKDGHDICFVSNGTRCPSSGHEKREWLKYYFGKLWKYPPLILTKEKFRVRGDCLLEDDPKNLIGLHRNTKPLLFHRSYNANATGNFERIYDWDHFLDWINNE